MGKFGSKYQAEGESLINHSSCRKTRCIDLSYGIRMCAELSFVLSQFTCLADGQTDGRADRRLYDQKYCAAYNAARVMLYGRLRQCLMSLYYGHYTVIIQLSLRLLWWAIMKS